MGQPPNIEERRYLLDGLFETLAMVSEEQYLCVSDLTIHVARWSRNAVEFFGLPGEIVEQSWEVMESHVHPEEAEAFRLGRERLNGQRGYWDWQYRLRNNEGKYTLCTCRTTVLRDIEGIPTYVVMMIRNHGIQSRMDAITGLRNQYGFLADVENLLRQRKEAVIGMIGLSHFSEVNNLYGYEFGNRVIQTLGQHFKTHIGRFGTVYRLDGAKYALITQEKTLDELREAYGRVYEWLRRGFEVDGHTLSLTINAGAMELKEFGIVPRTVLSCLEYSYSESKHNHRGELVAFEESVIQNRSRIELINTIRTAVIEDCRGFELFYQPVVYCADETLKGAEALIRWWDEEHGLVPPDAFIPVLEVDPLFSDLGKWILRRAMEDGVRFLKKYPRFILNVNLSYAQVERKNFVNEVRQLLRETGFPAEQLCLEITERCRLLNTGLLESVMIQLRSQGIQFALDDFGTGFSSLETLKNLPVDTVKIDRAFVKDIETDSVGLRTVQLVSEISKLYSCDVCAEGIETGEMRRLLVPMAVNSLQGYLYSKPVPFDDFMKLEFKT